MPPPDLPNKSASSPRRRFDPAKLAVEIGSIVFAVLLAFAVNAWWADRDAQGRVEAVEAAVRQEIETNRTLLAARLPYHAALKDSIWAQQRRFDSETLGLRAGERLPRLRQLGFDSGLATASELTRSGWETALATDVLTRMDVADVNLLSATYARQEMVNRTADRLLDVLGKYREAIVTGDQPAVALFGFGASLTDLVLRQEEQAVLYDSLLVVLGAP